MAGVKSILRDGAYQVSTSTICAGFIVRNGNIARNECAPVLWKKIDYWMRRATRVCDAPPREVTR